MKTEPGAQTLVLRFDGLHELASSDQLTWTVASPSSSDVGGTQSSFRAMGCAVRAQVECEGPQVEQLVSRVPDWFETWEDRLSRFRPQSELSRLNARPGEMVAVSPVLWQVIHASLEAARLTQGLVTPTVLPALEAAGYDRSFADLDLEAEADVAAPEAAPDWRAIRFEPKERKLCLPKGTRLDLGGIGKGWAADRAAARLKRLGPAMVEAGGDIAVSGRRSRGQAWRIAVADPRQPDRDLAYLAATSGGVATSGKDFRRWRRGGAWQHHLIDPRTGRPSISDVWSATVLAPSLQLAEVATKLVVLLGSDEGLRWIERRPNLAAMVVLEDGTRLDSRRLRDHLWRE